MTSANNISINSIGTSKFNCIYTKIADLGACVYWNVLYLLLKNKNIRKGYGKTFLHSF